MFSVVIPSLNDDRILKTLESIINQKFPQNLFEIIIQDGGSNQQLLDQIRKKIRKIDQLHIEKDNGIWDAYNKAYQKATYDYVISIGSDDYFNDKSLFEKIRQKIMNTNIKIIFYGVQYVNQNHQVVRRWPIRKFNELNKLLGFQYPHLGMAIKKEYLQSFDFTKSNLKASADYIFFLNLKLKQYEISYLSGYFVSLGVGGVSSKNLYEIIKHNFSIFLYILRYDFKYLLGFFFKPVIKFCEKFFIY